MSDTRPLLNRLEWHACTLNEPAGGVAGYRGLLSEALGEIHRLSGLQAPVHCGHCNREIDRADDWFRCTDCRGHYHEVCIKLHARDWRPSHG
jgi:hypothetical protein